MKITDLMLIFLIAVPAWATNLHSAAFFVKIGGSLVPLSGQEFNGLTDGPSSFCYSDPADEPVMFTLKNGIARTTDTSTPGFASIYNDGLCFGPDVPPTKLILDADMRLRNQKFSSCSSIKNRLRVITTSDEFENCFPVEVYVLPYNKKTKTRGKYVHIGKTDFDFIFVQDFGSGDEEELEPFGDWNSVPGMADLLSIQSFL